MRNRILTVLGIVTVLGGIMYAMGIRMTKADLHISAKAEPLFCVGGSMQNGECIGSLLPFTNSFLMTIIVDLVLLAVIFIGMRNMKLVPTGLQNFVEVVIEAFYNFALGVDRKNIAKFFPIPATILIFFLVANMMALIPGVGSIGLCMPAAHEGAASEHAPALKPGEVDTTKVNPFFANLPGACYKEGEQEYALHPFLRAPAADLNVTLAFALVAVVMVEFYGFQALGIGYLGKFFNFKEGPLNAMVGIMELISEVMRLIAFAFRIFGNIFGGEVVLVVMSFLFPFILPLPFYFLEVFVALIQAIIFSVLTLIFMSLAVQAHGGHDEHAEHAEHHETTDVVKAAAH